MATVAIPKRMIQWVRPFSELILDFEDMKRSKLNWKVAMIYLCRSKAKGMDFLQELSWRGMRHQHIEGVEDYLSQSGQFGYIGFDPTADSLTIGNLVQVMILTFFQRCGHRPIVLMGGATGRIGDPSGKSEERKLLDADLIEDNLSKQIAQVEGLLDFDPKHGAILENNYDFYKDMNVLDYLRDLGKTLTINYMLSKDSVKNRLDTGMSYTEFSYQILQGYDFLHLYRKYGCALQMGGSDQWGNITSGTEFIRRSEPGAKAYAITTPLLTKADGSKFGKSEGGNIWLSPEKTSPYKFYQFWINAADSELPSLLRYFSLKGQEEVEGLEQEHDGNPNAIKKLLAVEITSRIHGNGAAKRAQDVSELIFGRSVNAESIRGFDAETLKAVAGEIPHYTIAKGDLLSSTSWGEVLTERAPVFQSKGDFRRSIKGNALAINKVKLSDDSAAISQSDLLNGGYILVENGKKNKFILSVKA